MIVLICVKNNQLFNLDDQFFANGTFQNDFQRTSNMTAEFFQDPIHDGSKSRLDLAQKFFKLLQFFSIFLGLL